MKHQVVIPRYVFAIGAISIALSAVAVVLLAFAIISPANSASLMNSSEISSNILADEPGLTVTGYVRLNDSHGPGFESAAIYRSYAAYSGTQIATTDLQGYYDTGYYFIPGNERVTVWATRDGYNLEPQQFSWLHYYGYENRELNFVATLLVTNCSTPPSPHRILVARGSWDTTELDHQLNIFLGQGATTITITSEAGTVVKTGDLLMPVTIPLLPNTLHHLKVDVKFEQEDGCFYITSTEYDFSGLPLTINQQLAHKRHLPLVLNKP